MNAETFLEQFETFAEAPNAVEQLRRIIFELAANGRILDCDISSTVADNTQLLGQVAEFIMGQAPPGSECNTSGLGTVFVKTGEFGPLYPDSVEWTTKPLKHAKKGDVLICVVGATVGKLNLAIDCAIGRSVAAIRPSPLLETKYLYYMLKPYVLKLRSASRGSAQGVIGREELKNVRVWVPSLAIQSEVVAKVDQLLALCDELAARQEARRVARAQLVGATLDRLVSTRSAADLPPHVNRLRTHFDHLFDTPTTIPKLRQTILQLAVQGQLVPHDPNDEPAEILIDKIYKHRREFAKQTPVPVGEDEVDGQIPSHWRWARLNDLVSVMDSGWSPACDEEPTTDESEWGVLKTTAVQTMYFNEAAHKRLPSNLVPRPEAEAKSGDLLITRAGPQNRVGISCLVKEVRPRLMISDKIIRFHLIEPFLFAEFVSLCLNAGASQAHIEKSKSGMAASQVNISQVKFRMTPIPVPPLAEQKRIVAKVTELLSLCDTLEAQLQTAESASSQLLSAAVHHLLNSQEVSV